MFPLPQRFERKQPFQHLCQKQCQGFFHLRSPADCRKYSDSISPKISEDLYQVSGCEARSIEINDSLTDCCIFCSLLWPLVYLLGKSNASQSHHRIPPANHVQQTLDAVHISIGGKTTLHSRAFFVISYIRHEDFRPSVFCPPAPSRSGDPPWFL